jgi:hypothetical protein
MEISILAKIRWVRILKKITYAQNFWLPWESSC